MTKGVASRLNTIRGFLSDTLVFPPFTLKKLVNLGSLGLDTAIGYRDQHTNIHGDLAHAYGNKRKRSDSEDSDDEGDYDDTKYQTMNEDINRNCYFLHSIKRASRSVSTWVEIGPGASAFLTKLVLRSSPTNTIFAIEGTPTSAALAESTLRESGFSLNRYRIAGGLAGQVPLPGDVDFDGFVAEILGHTASNEGLITSKRV